MSFIMLKRHNWVIESLVLLNAFQFHPSSVTWKRRKDMKVEALTVSHMDLPEKSVQ